MQTDNKAYNGDGQESWLLSRRIRKTKTRVDKENPSEVYADFWDWVTRSWHVALLLSLFFSYFVCLLTTEEV